jgi:hypothetical protein
MIHCPQKKLLPRSRCLLLGPLPKAAQGYPQHFVVAQVLFRLPGALSRRCPTISICCPSCLPVARACFPLPGQFLGCRKFLGILLAAQGCLKFSRLPDYFYSFLGDFWVLSFYSFLGDFWVLPNNLWAAQTLLGCPMVV